VFAELHNVMIGASCPFAPVGEVERAGMWALVKIAAVFAVMVLLIRRKMAIGYVLLIASGLLGLALGVGFEADAAPGFGWAVRGVGGLLRTMAVAATRVPALRLIVLVLTISVFGAVLRHVEKLRALADSLLALLRDRRWTMGSLASLIGLLPMPGGAMVSAPMVGEVARDVDLKPDEKAAINHWMRHVWEYIDPLYPGLLYASAIFAVPVTNLMLAHSPFTVVAIIAGIVFLLRRVPHHQRGVGEEAGARAIRPVIVAILPVLVVIAAAMAPQIVSLVAKATVGEPNRAGMRTGQAGKTPPAASVTAPAAATVAATARADAPWWDNRKVLRAATEWCMLAALILTTLVLLRANRVGRKDTWRLVGEGATRKMAALVLGVVVLKGMMEASGTVDPIAQYLTGTGLPGPVVIGTVVFVVGMLLGYSFGYVAICFPLLHGMLLDPDGSLNYPLAAFAYALGFLGVLLSPVHLCLVLSREHFEARWGGVYKWLLVPSVAVFAMACVMLLFA
jgi:hypothetical protein